MKQIKIFLVFCSGIFFSQQLYSFIDSDNIEMTDADWAEAMLELLPIKESILFSDGVTLAKLEADLRQRHPAMPDIVCFPELKNQTSMGYGELFFGRKVIMCTDISHYSSHEASLALQHEIGHSLKPNSADNIEKAFHGLSKLSFAGILCYGVKNLYYNKNKLMTLRNTSYTSCLAALMLNLGYYAAHNIEERRADDFANTHATLDELHGGIKFFKEFQKNQKKYWQTYQLSKFLSYSIGEFVIGPKHPSSDSRIAKIEQEIARRTTA